jgi:hypothetical protein
MASQDLCDHLNSQRHIDSWCFGAPVHVERYPNNFNPPREVTKYDGSDNPSLWLEDYEMVMTNQERQRDDHDVLPSHDD